MAQNTEIALQQVRYTRADFTSLRAWLNKLPLRQIRNLYYHEDDLAELGCETDAGLMTRLNELRDQLIARAADTNPYLAEMMNTARQRGFWSPKLVDHLVQAPDSLYSEPKRSDRISIWFKPLLTSTLNCEGIFTIGDLVSIINLRGKNWWMPIPRVGEGRAINIENWLSHYKSSLGSLETGLVPLLPVNKVVLFHGHPVVPLESIALPTDLDGHAGLNRCANYCQIKARNDLSAINSYLMKFKGKPKTERAYRKEIERFLLWCITERGIAMSSALTDDCEAYKDFLASVPSYWIADSKHRLPRKSYGWRPFVGQLSKESQKYAVSAVVFFFNWLVKVRYLGGNPWETVSLPDTVKKIDPINIEKALPEDVWRHLTEQHGILDTLCAIPDDELRKRYKLRGHAAYMSMSAHFRLLRAVLLLLGDTGMRREELVFATRENLKPIIGNRKIWELKVVGKRNKERFVFPSRRSIIALREHWIDRKLENEFDLGMSERPLISPLIAPNTRTGKAKHLEENSSAGEVVIDAMDNTEMKDAAYSPDGLYRFIKIQLNRIANDYEVDMTEEERDVLSKSSTHDFRHTFATQAVAKGVPLDVMQKVLGHASLQTTTLYVRAEKKRSIDELGKFFD